MLKISTISVLPDIFQCLNYGMSAIAQSRGVVMDHINISHHSTRPYGRVDDRPFGGGPGMVIQADILHNALAALRSTSPDIHVIIPDPKGKPFTQKDARRLSLSPHLVFICGRYEGLDQRFLDTTPHESFSVFDAISSGGEIPSALMIDAIIRELDNVLGNPQSLKEDSFQNNRLDHAHYTRPWDWQSITPPDILRSGHHKNVMRWRNQQSIGTTWLHRPDLIMGQKLKPEDIENMMIFLNQQEFSHERDS